MIDITKNEARGLFLLAIIGLTIPNGFFIYYFLTDQEISKQALSNPISLVFIVEAFVLMFLFAWLLNKTKISKINGLQFILMSLMGSMVFSVPYTIYIILKEPNN